MKKSLIVAALIVLAVVGWLSSGMIDGDRGGPGVKALDQNLSLIHI